MALIHEPGVYDHNQVNLEVIVASLPDPVQFRLKDEMIVQVHFNEDASTASTG